MLLHLESAFESNKVLIVLMDDFYRVLLLYLIQSITSQANNIARPTLTLNQKHQEV